MIKKLLHRLLLRQHFWRHANFDELSEMYVAMLLRSLALGLIGIFVPVYLLQQGFGFDSVLLFYFSYFLSRSLFDIVGAYIVARFGPKHTMLISYLFQIVAVLLFSSLESIAWPLWFPAIVWGFSASLFFIAFHVDFSKIKHAEHGGKELGWLNVVERTGGMLGPLVGGIIATVFGGQYLFLAASVLFMVGLVPLFQTAEPVRAKQKLEYRKLDVRTIRRDLLANTAFVIERNMSIVIWPVYLTVFVFTEKVYATIGSLATIGVLVSILAAYLVGRLADTKHASQLLRFGTIGNALVHLLRPMVQNAPSALALNIANEAVTVTYSIPYVKGLYDAADRHPGLRIVYLSTLESFASFVKALIWLELLMLSAVLTTYQLVLVGFIIAAIASVLINTQRFKALQ